MLHVIGEQEWKEDTNTRFKVNKMITATMAGLILAWLVISTESLIAPIAIHSMINGIGLTLNSR